MTGSRETRQPATSRPAGPRVVLAYSGGLVSTAAIAWLIETRKSEVVCVTLDLGQKEDLLQVRDRALNAGAVRVHVMDARRRFATGHVLPSLQADALDDGGRPLVRAIARPLLAEVLVEVAELELAPAVSHGAREGDALDVSLRTLGSSLEIIVPPREWGMSRADLPAFARERGLGLPSESAEAAENLWGRVGAADGSGIQGSASVSQALLADVELAFERGVPTSINAVAMPLVELISSLDTIAGAYGAGHFTAARDHMLGTPTAIDAPAAVVLHLAHRALSNETLPPDLRHLLRPLGSAYADLLAKGRWHSPAREAIDAFVASAQRFVTGTVKLRLSDGDCTVVECEGGSGSSSGIVDPHGRPAGTSDGPPKPTAVEG